MRPIKSLYEHPNLDVVVLFAGDGDFRDMVEFMMQTHKVKFYIVGWSASMNKELAALCTEVIYLDSKWDDLSTSNGGELTNAEVLKMIGISETVSYAATRKYPEPVQRDLCIEFAF